MNTNTVKEALGALRRLAKLKREYHGAKSYAKQLKEGVATARFRFKKRRAQSSGQSEEYIYANETTGKSLYRG